MDNSTSNKDSWGEYGKLVLKELERLNETQERLRSDLDGKLSELNHKFNELRSFERTTNQNSNWIEKVNDVWSPSQMKQAKDEIYKQKNKWSQAIAILVFIQILISIAISIWGKFNI